MMKYIMEDNPVSNMLYFTFNKVSFPQKSMDYIYSQP